MLNSKENRNRGQALVEFALSLIAILLFIFFIIESGRVLWGWVTVQNAARDGARYAVTGQFSGPECAVAHLPKFNNPDRNNACRDVNNRRPASIVSIVHQRLVGLPLNEISFVESDENYYDIFVWGVNVDGVLQGSDLPDPNGPDPFAGSPNNSIIVRVIYRVPIITPLLSAVVPSIPVMGQVTMNNEAFGQLGNNSSGVSQPPGLPPVPTAGPTPTNTPTPSPTFTATIGPSPTNTSTPTATLTPPSEFCDVLFDRAPIAGNNFVLITGDIGTQVTIQSLTNGDTLGIATLGTFDGHVCPGFSDFSTPNQLNRPLLGGERLIAISSDGTSDEAIVGGGTATPTTTASPTVTGSPTPSGTPTMTPTATPSTAFIDLLPNCGRGPDVQFRVLGANWPDEQVTLYWTGQVESVVQAGHGGFFQQNWTKRGLSDGVYTVQAVSANATFSTNLTVPCPGPPLPTVTATATSTPLPPDLIVVGAPSLVSNPPIIAYQPVTFNVEISNVGQVDINSLFFVDLYLDPGQIGASSIPLSESSGYTAVDGLPGGQSRTITITASGGFANLPTNHQVYGMVDSVEQINESIETNNISAALVVDSVFPAATPTYTPTPPTNGSETISGVVRVLFHDWVPQFRTQVTLLDQSSGGVLATAITDNNGFYQFRNLPAGSYTVTACFNISNVDYSGIITGVAVPTQFADIFMVPGVCVP